MSTRSLGFSLTVKGSDQTTKQLDLIKAKLAEVTKEIKAIKGTPISLSTKFDSKSISDFLKTLEKVKTTKFNPELQKDFAKLKSELISVKKEMTLLQSQLEKTKEPVLTGSGLDKINGKIIKMNGHAKDAVETLTKIGPTLTAIKDHNVDQLDQSLGSMLVKLKEIQGQKKITLANPNLSGAEKSAVLDSLLAQEKELKNQFKETSKEIEIQNKAFRAQASAFPVDSIIGLRKEVGLLKKEYDSLPQAEREAAKGQALITSINQKKQVINDANELMGNFQHNVGNYKSAVTALLPELEKLQGEGRIAQKELIDVFRKENIARAAELEKKIQELAIEFKSLGTAAENAGKRAAVLDQLTNATRELSAVSSNTQKIGNDFQRLQGKLLGVSDIVTGGLIGGGILATIGAVKSFGAASLSEFTQASTALAKINQQLIVTGGASGKSAEGLQRTAKELEVLTGIDGDQILNDVTSSLLRFGSIQGEVFDKAQKAAIDLAATMGGDLAGAANLVGKALEDPEKGITRLAKAGVILDKETEKAVKNAIKSNDTYKAQTILLGALEAKFKGVAEAVQNSELGNIRQFKVDINNLKEAIGKFIVGGVNKLFQFFKDLKVGVNLFSDTSIEFERGIKNFQHAANEEILTIGSLIGTLKDETASRGARNAAIQQLIDKYPGLITQMDLEYASSKRLDEIQKTLTKTTIEELGKRIKAETKAALLQKAINVQLEIDRLKAGKTSGNLANVAALEKGLSKFTKAITGGLIDYDKPENSILTRTINHLEKSKSQIATDLTEIEGQIDESVKNLTSAFSVGGSNLEQAKSLLSGAITESFDLISSETASKQAKEFAAKVQKDFGDLYDSLINKNETLPESKLETIINDIIKLQPKFDQFKKSLPLKVTIDDEQAKNEQKQIEDNYKRILDLKRQIEDLQIGNIANTFNQQIAKVEATTKRQIEDIQHDLDSLELKNVKTPQDLQIIAKSKELISELQAESNKQIELINGERAKALDAALSKLIEIQNEVQKIIKEVGNTEIDIQINEQNFNLDQSKRLIEVEFKTNLDTLNAEFAKGLISEEDYTAKSLQLEANKFAALDKLINDSKDEFIKNLNLKASAEISLINEIKKIQIKAIEDAAKADLRQVEVDFNEGKIKSIQEAEAQKIAIVTKASAEIKKIETDSVKDRKKIEQDLEVNKNKVLDDGVEAHRSAEEAKTEITKTQSKARTDKEKEALQALKDNAIQLGEELANAILEINASRAEQRYEQEKSFIDREYDNKIKLAQGNSSEITKLERERDQKLKELDREQARRRQKQAISEAIIQGSLAIIKAFATLGPILAAITTPFIIGTTAIQIAKIKAQSFAKGAYFNRKGQGGFTGASQAPPDETGERPIGTGILHADEFIMTARQTRKHNWLAHLLDKDRLKTNAGGTSSLEMDLAEALQRRRQAIYNIPKPNEAKYTPIIPVIVPVGGQSLNQEVKFSDEQAYNMALIMAEEIAKKAGSAIYSGSKDGLVEATKETLRKERTTLRATA